MKIRYKLKEVEMTPGTICAIICFAGLTHSGQGKVAPLAKSRVTRCSWLASFNRISEIIQGSCTPRLLEIKRGEKQS